MSENLIPLVLFGPFVLVALGLLFYASVCHHRGSDPLDPDVVVPILFCASVWYATLLAAVVYSLGWLAHKSIGLLVKPRVVLPSEPPDLELADARREVDQMLDRR